MNSHKNGLYRAFHKMGRVIRTITLLRSLSEPVLREQITAITNKAEAFHGYAEWLMIGGRLIDHNDPGMPRIFRAVGLWAEPVRLVGVRNARRVPQGVCGSRVPGAGAAGCRSPRWSG
ncbi:Tn3 family transposase [Streptosporangium sp. NPDC000239]|uniref:Tn3 family transposase n=1 Tax=Streptosporangium sp. NPDC000239 TaxID=3154248 RepID=UPI003320F318